MQRQRNITIAAIILAIAALILLFTLLSDKEVEAAIPESAMAVWQVDETVPPLAFAQRDLSILASIDALLDQPITAILQPNTPDQFSILFLTKIKKSTWQKLQKTSRKLSIWKGIPIYKSQDRRAILAYHKGILMIAPHAIQVEQAITQLKENNSDFSSLTKEPILRAKTLLNVLRTLVKSDVADIPIMNMNWGENWEMTKATDSLLQFSTADALPFLVENKQSPTPFFNLLPAETDAFLWSKKEASATSFLTTAMGDFISKRDVGVDWIWSMFKYNNEWQPLAVFPLNRSGVVQLEQVQNAVDQVVMFEIYRGNNGFFFSFDNDYLWITKDRETLNHVLNAYIGGQTLAKEPTFLAAYANTSEEQNALIYTRHNAAQELIAQRLDLKDKLTQKQLIDYFEQPQQFFLLFQSGTATTATLQILPSQEHIIYRAPTTLEALPLEANLNAIPTIVEWEGIPYILAQDEAFRLYVFDIDGTPLWIKELDEALQAPPQLLQDGRLFFQTPYRVYLCDLEGDYLAGYPFDLPLPTVTPVCLVDFTGQGEYYYFITNEVGQVYGYDLARNLLKGWSPKDTIGTQIQNIQHAQRNGDYIIIHADSSLQVFDRGGRTRFRIDDPLFAKATIDHQMSTESARIVAATPEGKLKIINFAGESFNLQFAPHRQFLFEDVWGDRRKDYIAVQSRKIIVYAYDENNKYDIRYTIPLEQKVDEVFVVDGQIGTLNKADQTLMWYDRKGEVLDGFPLAGNTTFIVKNDVVYVGNDAEVTRYHLSK
ncbi:MAG: hypothetical protein AAGI23_22455 [Bacteroidota bacterium]